MGISSQASIQFVSRYLLKRVSVCTHHRENSLHLAGSRGAQVFLVDYNVIVSRLCTEIHLRVIRRIERRALCASI